MLDEPYLASAVARFPFVDVTERGWCELVATDGYFIYFNRDALEPIEQRHLCFMFAHEVMHCILGHSDRGGTRDQGLWNCAADYAINLMLVECGMEMPPMGLFDPKYRGLTAEEIYERLEAHTPDELEFELSGGVPVPSVRSSGSRSFDLHLPVSDLRGSEDRAREYPSKTERARIRVPLAQRLEEHVQGTTRGRSSAEVAAARSQRVPWQQLLAQFVAGIRRNDYRIFPPNRKHLWRGLYLPSIGVPGPRLLAVAVDTSASMTDAQIAEILGEIDQLRSGSDCSLVLLQCDAAIQEVARVDPWDHSYFSTSGDSRRHHIRGRGGTDFRPVFDWLSDHAIENEGAPDALIYCTDGYGAFPEKSPDYPVVWIASRSNTSCFPFGAVIELVNSSLLT